MDDNGNKHISGESAMRMVVITGSPHRNGTTAALADAFIEGAKEAKHDIFRFDVADYLGIHESK